MSTANLARDGAQSRDWTVAPLGSRKPIAKGKTFTQATAIAREHGRAAAVRK